MDFSSHKILASVLAAVYPSPLIASSYLDSYPALRAQVASFGELNEAEFIVAAHMIYGWMPTILHLKVDSIKKVLPIIETARQGHCLDKVEVQKLATVVNGSVVGASKFLHFVNPNSYPIWDSRVFHFMNTSCGGGQQKGHFYQINDAATYVAYAETCRDIVANEAFQPAYYAILAQFNLLPAYQETVISPLRALEYIMFTAQGN